MKGAREHLSKFNYWKLMRRVLYLISPICLVLYMVLCTYLWQIVGRWFYPPKTNYIQFAQNEQCKNLDWVLQKFQPLVSDQEMIDHLNKNRYAMTQLAEKKSNEYINHGAMYSTKLNGEEINEKLNITVGSYAPWRDEPYSYEKYIYAANINNVCVNEDAKNYWQSTICKDKLTAAGENKSVLGMIPLFGKNSEHFFCSGAKQHTKMYLYFPGKTPPKIENGKLHYSISLNEKPFLPPGAIVTSTDRSPAFNEGQIVRQIDARWFISNFNNL